ncbi:energy-coupling factor transporter ATP-binding protein EcfA [Brevibacillus reuszeri]|uniref:Energy-coupling factor transporter ATP-binding protein EcfA2 n=1 Tax=Brevibacillus reuszeri TaxID=54915 RepID=A0A0K9YQG9_9BACL|nr:energy-coupling factor transporter ATPase [Brevibacillus reuszeri]KNB70974.1 cobalt transporter ATP-binding subunit [Brevibacillus reuszeri]MED1857384.1 energy-coupling factor transporter ATPase [Brevibacillus reuszeri]GED66786.1 energy-coupling factor transporter ATP-binding protein EcfA [Brevibacillus reuszeri]
MTQTSPMVSVKNLSHVYMQGTPLQHRALDQVDLEVAEGECLAIIGHTGSGKSTLIQHFNGLIRPQSGSVVINGLDVSQPKLDIRTLRRQVGLVFQNPEDQLFEKLVGDDVAYGPFKMGLPLEEVRRRVHWAMELVGLSFQEMKDRPTFALSGGQKRKVALAGVLSLQPKVLVLDEPTAGLDPRSRKELLERIRGLNREEKLTVIFVSHNMEEVAQLADRVYVMANGKAVLDGTPRQIFGNQQLLRDHHIGTPESVDILYRLREEGYEMDPGAYLPEDAALEILKLIKR